MSVRHLVLAGALALPVLLAPQVGGPIGFTARVDAAQAASIAERAPIATQPPEAWADADPADSLYRQARELLNRGSYKRAAALFEEITRRHPTSAYAGDALYWRAFALYRSGGDDDLREALVALEAQRARYPRATTTADASALEVRIHGVLARHGDAESAEKVFTAAAASATPRTATSVKTSTSVRTSTSVSTSTRCATSDDAEDSSDVRTAALNALLQMDAERAVPIIRQVLARRDPCSVPLRRKAVFLLSQQSTAEAEALLLGVIRSDPSQRVREEAVFWTGQLRSDRAAAALEEIALRSPGEAMREKAVFALGQQNLARGQAVVRRLAAADDTPERIREKAIFQLGQQRSADNARFLRDLFARLPRNDRSEDLRKQVLFSLAQMSGEGNDRWLLSVGADGAESIEIRKHALWTAGEAGVAAAEFIPLYDRSTDRELKEHLIWILSESRDRAAADKLIDIARRDRDLELRRKAIFWLGQSHDPRVQQLLLDLLSKE